MELKKIFNNSLLKWWIQVVCYVFTGVVVYELGWWHALYNADITKLSFVILGLFVLSTLLTGYISKNNQLRNSKLSNYVWFSSETMVTIGMIGTVAGFLMMLGTAFTSLDVSDTKNIQTAIATMAVGMSTALSTTLIGLICSVLIKFQMLLVEKSEDEKP